MTKLTSFALLTYQQFTVGDMLSGKARGMRMYNFITQGHLLIITIDILLPGQTHLLTS